MYCTLWTSLALLRNPQQSERWLFLCPLTGAAVLCLLWPSLNRDASNGTQHKADEDLMRLFCPPCFQPLNWFLRGQAADLVSCLRSGRATHFSHDEELSLTGQQCNRKPSDITAARTLWSAIVTWLRANLSKRSAFYDMTQLFHGCKSAHTVWRTIETLSHDLCLIGAKRQANLLSAGEAL